MSDRVRKLLGYGSEEHHQIYWAWRLFPLAMLKTMGLGYGIGSMVTAILFVAVGWLM